MSEKTKQVSGRIEGVDDGQFWVASEEQRWVDRGCLPVGQRPNGKGFAPPEKKWVSRLEEMLARPERK